ADSLGGDDGYDGVRERDRENSLLVLGREPRDLDPFLGRSEAVPGARREQRLRERDAGADGHLVGEPDALRAVADVVAQEVPGDVARSRQRGEARGEGLSPDRVAPLDLVERD